jgi:phytoene/squalene synthetase
MDPVHGESKTGSEGGSALNRHLSYCLDTVRRYDRDRFLLGLTVPASRRAALWALFAFNHEIAKTREVVSEPTLGLIRLQWWRDALNQLYQGKVLEHEVLAALASVIREHNLPRAWFDELINAREIDLGGKPLASLRELEDYARDSATPLNRLVLRILGQNAEEKIIRAVSTAYALTGLLRAAPFKDNFLPHGVTAGQVADSAGRNLDEAGPVRGYLKASSALTRLYLARIKRGNYELSDIRLNLPPVGFAIRALTGGFR